MAKIGKGRKRENSKNVVMDGAEIEKCGKVGNSEIVQERRDGSMLAPVVVGNQQRLEPR